MPPWEQLVAGLEGFLEVRDSTSERILAGLFPDQPPPKARGAVTGWLWCMDGVLLYWIEHRDLERHEVRDLLLGSLGGMLAAAATRG